MNYVIYSTRIKHGEGLLHHREFKTPGRALKAAAALHGIDNDLIIWIMIRHETGMLEKYKTCYDGGMR